MSIQFPANPQLNATFDYDDKTYIWDGEKWTASAIGSFDEAYVNISGDTMTGDLTVPSLNGGQIAGMRNAIINGNFAISQRGTTWDNPSANSYFIDRWRFSSNFDGVLIQQVKDNNPIPGSDYHLEVAPIPAGTTWMRQGIEIPTGSPGPFSNGSIWTVSFWSFNGAYSLSNVEFSDVVAGGNNTGTWDISAPTVLETLGSWQHISHTVTCNKTPFASNQCVRVEWSLPGNTRGGLAQAMFEPGSVATPFEMRPIGTELALCQRYHHARADNILASKYTDGNAFLIDMPFPVTMRTAPTVATTQTVNWATIDLTSTNTHALVASGTALASNNPVFMQGFNADAEL